MGRIIGTGFIRYQQGEAYRALEGSRRPELEPETQGRGSFGTIVDTPAGQSGTTKDIESDVSEARGSRARVRWTQIRGAG